MTSPVRGPVRFQLAPSPALAACIAGAHGLAAAAAWIALPTLVGAALACAVFSLGLAAAWSRALLRAAGSLRAIEIEGGEARFELASGARLAAPAKSRRHVTRHLLTVPLGGRLSRTALVSADMLRPGEFRRLRIWALWNRLPVPRPAR